MQLIAMSAVVAPMCSANCPLSQCHSVVVTGRQYCTSGALVVVYVLEVAAPCASQQPRI